MNDKNDTNGKDDRFAEQWLDASLDRYADTEPRPGFETRLLATIAAEREKRPRWNRLWAWAAVAVAATVLIAVVVLSVAGGRERKPAIIAGPNTPPPARTADAPMQGASKVGSNSTSPNGATATTVARAPHRTVRSGKSVRGEERSANAVVANGPKQPQFPSPAPLSDQERMMLAYVRATPQSEIANVIEQKLAFQKHVDSLGVPEIQEKSDR